MSAPFPALEARRAQVRTLLKTLDTTKAADRTELVLAAMFGSPQR